jgi:preprotein translocase subunit SecA
LIRRWARGSRDLDLSPLARLAEEAGQREKKLSGLDAHSLKTAFAGLREPLASGSFPDSALADLFAITREVALRTLSLRPYDVQILAGLAMARGFLAEMRTGEGKTLCAVAPASLQALSGRGVHILTFNDYLARRDSEWMGPVYRCLGLSVGYIAEGMSPGERRAAYACDITYLTAKEAGFDFLRDSLARDVADRVQRPLHAALVDEADSILIDEARLPLVLAGRTDAEAMDPEQIGQAIRALEAGRDYEIDEHARNVNLTEAGLARVEERLGSGDLYASGNTALLTEIQNALHARALLRLDVDYIVRDGKIELVDELTGRVAEDRLWPDGLQAAIEAKEGVRPRTEGRILGSITMQHFIGQYPHLAGMTATAASAADELKEFYNLQVAKIPTHRPCIRVDLPDLVFTHKHARLEALLGEIDDLHTIGRPVLVGTASVAESEELAAILERRRIGCSVLNAKNDELEARIIADAGKPGAVTISTNMAGRGTDIRLGGADGREQAAVADLGGLHVIGTTRHESLRIDDQLRGRAGRQGDPGSTRFFISLEDGLIRRFGARNLLSCRRASGEQCSPMDHPLIHREIDRAQRIIEGQNFETRKTLHDYSSLVERQRRFIQRWRRAILEGDGGAGLLEEESPGRHAELRRFVDVEILREVERQISLRVIDRCWSEHLAEISEIRTGIHLVRLGGETPLDEFHKRAGDAFQALIHRIEEEIVRTFESVEVSPEGVDWDSESLRTPSSTWTYVVNDDPFDPNPMTGMAHSAAFGAVGTVFLWPILLAWGLWQRLRRRRRAVESGLFT